MKSRVVLFALLASSQIAGAETLTMEQAVQIALQQQPSARQARATADVARARVDSARVSLRPQLTLSVGADAAGGQGSSIKNTTGDVSLGANATWRITDFGLNRAQVRAAELNAEAAIASTDTNLLDIRTNVEISYLEAVARQRLLTVAETTVRSEELHVDQAKRFVAAQAKDPIEVAQAQARAALAKATLAQAQSSAAIAIANLRAAIGWMDPTQPIAVPPDWPSAPRDDAAPALPALVEAARSGRPELVALDRQVAAADATLDVARKSRRPVLAANARTSWTPTGASVANPATGSFVTDYELSHPTWSVGITLSWLAFDGGRQAADIKIATAQRESARAQRDALLLALTSQLDTARAQIDANRASIVASTEAVQSARAQLRLAEARYANGLGSQIELADAQVAVTTAEGNLVQAEWQLATAWTTLRRALGEGSVTSSQVPRR